MYTSFTNITIDMKVLKNSYRTFCTLLQAKIRCLYKGANMPTSSCSSGLTQLPTNVGS